MPKSAIATGFVDFVLPPAEIAQELMRINRHPLAVPGSAKPEELQGRGTSFVQILHLLHRATGMDFSLYKQSTLQRRIRRRLVIHRLNSLEAYVNFIQETPAEVGALTEDLFIKVTGFFRDPKAFEDFDNSSMQSQVTKVPRWSFRIQTSILFVAPHPDGTAKR